MAFQKGTRAFSGVWERGKGAFAGSSAAFFAAVISFWIEHERIIYEI